MRKSKIVLRKLNLIILIIGLLFTLFACSNRYGAVLFDSARSWVKEDFLKANMTYDSFYYEGDGSDGDKLMQDKTSPKSRVYIILDQQECDRIFKQVEVDVDFDNEMLILYIFTTSRGFSTRYVLKNLTLENGIITIDYYIGKDFGPPIVDETAPIQECFVVKMKKVDATWVVFNIIN